MTCSELANRIEQLAPHLSPVEIGRLATLILNSMENPVGLDFPEEFNRLWEETNLRMQAANDQHQAMTHELESLAKSDPRKFTPDQIWILIRAIKVQSQVLRLYVGDPAYELG
ncbi:MAG: hypothetical protein ACK6DS_10065 [Planctomycetota bacterium]